MGFAACYTGLRCFAAKDFQTVEATVKKSGFSFFLTGNHAKFDFLMTSPEKTQGKSVDDILQDRAHRSTQRILTDQRHLQAIERDVKGIKRIVRKHAKRHR
jgi:hypothetical protein